MNSERAQAYGRLMKAVRAEGPEALDASEQQIVREAADALLFSADLDSDPGARAALAAVTALADELIAADRILASRAHRLLDDIWACGPAAGADLTLAA
jgi:hypothetical protein